MGKTIKDNRLPKGVNIYLNEYEEYVAVEFGKVAQVDRVNVRMGRTVDEAVENYRKADSGNREARNAEKFRMEPWTGDDSYEED